MSLEQERSANDSTEINKRSANGDDKKAEDITVMDKEEQEEEQEEEEEDLLGGFDESF